MPSQASKPLNQSPRVLRSATLPAYAAAATSAHFSEQLSERSVPARAEDLTKAIVADKAALAVNIMRALFKAGKQAQIPDALAAGLSAMGLRDSTVVSLVDAYKTGHQQLPVRATAPHARLKLIAAQAIELRFAEFKRLFEKLPGAARLDQLFAFRHFVEDRCKQFKLAAPVFNGMDLETEIRTLAREEIVRLLAAVVNGDMFSKVEFLRDRAGLNPAEIRALATAEVQRRLSSAHGFDLQRDAAKALIRQYHLDQRAEIRAAEENFLNREAKNILQRISQLVATKDPRITPEILKRNSIAAQTKFGISFEAIQQALLSGLQMRIGQTMAKSSELQAVFEARNELESYRLTFEDGERRFERSATYQNLKSQIAAQGFARLRELVLNADVSIAVSKRIEEAKRAQLKLGISAMEMRDFAASLVDQLFAKNCPAENSFSVVLAERLQREFKLL